MTEADLQAFLPLKTQWFHIMLSLAGGEQHGYGIMQEVLNRTTGKVRLWPATLYGSIKRLIEEGRNHLLLGGMIETGCPVRILQGVQDPDVPWNHAVELTSRLAQDDVVLTLVKDGDHRLSRPEDLERLIKAVAEF